MISNMTPLTYSNGHSTKLQMIISHISMVPFLLDFELDFELDFHVTLEAPPPLPKIAYQSDHFYADKFR